MKTKKTLTYILSLYIFSLAQRLSSTRKCFETRLLQIFFSLFLFFLYCANELKIANLIIIIRDSSLVNCFFKYWFTVFSFP